MAAKISGPMKKVDQVLKKRQFYHHVSILPIRGLKRMFSGCWLALIKNVQLATAGQHYDNYGSQP